MSAVTYQTFALLAAALGGGAYIPYARDIIKGKVRPARASRIMFVILLGFALAQQHSVGTGLALAVTLGEVAGSVAVLLLTPKYGVGGWSRIDIICYTLLGVDLLIWLTTRSPFLALHLTVVADLIAFWPTLHKLWRRPKSETPVFYIVGTLAAVLALLAQPRLSYGAALFPAYLVLINALGQHLYIEKLLCRIS